MGVPTLDDVGASKTKRTREAFVRRNFGKNSLVEDLLGLCLFGDFNSLRRSVSGASHAPNLFLWEFCRCDVRVCGNGGIAYGGDERLTEMTRNLELQKSCGFGRWRYLE